MSSIFRPLRIVGSVALVASTAFSTSTRSVSAASSCPDGWTATGYMACEYRVTTSGDVTLPEGWGPYDYLVIGGGGGGGGGGVATSEDSGDQSLWQNGGGGGGAGGYTLCIGKSETTVTVTLGAGGAGGKGDDSLIGSSGQAENGGDGESSSAGDCTAAGGKGGHGGGMQTFMTGYGRSMGGESGNGEYGRGGSVNCSSSWQHPRCAIGSSVF